MRVYGYIGIITRGQSTDRQQQALKDYAVKNNLKYTTVFEDKAGGKSYERSHYKALQKIVKSGDTVIIKELNGLGRNHKEIQQELLDFKSKGVKLLILDMIINLINYVA